jgi:hypothetical protein
MILDEFRKKNRWNWSSHVALQDSQINHAEKNNAWLRNELAGSAWCILCVSFGGVIA